VVDYWTRNVLSVPKGTGSGFIWDDLGHVVTNFHVIEGASEAVVRLNDGRSYKGGLVGASPTHDLAVLRIDVAFDQPPAVPIGSSGQLKVGQKVFAIGNPFGLDYTLTSGLISALDRSLAEDSGATIHHLIQTDAAINPGNSGGPLLDSAGRLIGINTAIFSPSGAYAGIGFAVPVDTVNRIVPQLIAEGEYVRPSLGIVVDPKLNDLISTRIGIDGAVVLKVQPDSSAELAGLRGTVVDRNGAMIVGDIIVAINDELIDSVPTLQQRLDDHRIGDQVILTVVRADQRMQVAVVLQRDH
jgi:S1-C subfamily serine protease